MVYYFDQNKTYVEARRHCKSYDSHLLEIWNVEEWNEVKIDNTDSSPIWKSYPGLPAAEQVYKLFLHAGIVRGLPLSTWVRLALESPLVVKFDYQYNSCIRNSAAG